MLAIPGAPKEKMPSSLKRITDNLSVKKARRKALALLLPAEGTLGGAVLKARAGVETACWNQSRETAGARSYGLHRPGGSVHTLLGDTRDVLLNGHALDDLRVPVWAKTSAAEALLAFCLCVGCLLCKCLFGMALSCGYYCLKCLPQFLEGTRQHILGKGERSSAGNVCFAHM